MNVFVSIVLMLALIVALTYAVARALFEAIAVFKTRMTYLELVERDPSLAAQAPGLAATTGTNTSCGHDFALTGVLLSLLGLMLGLAGRYYEWGRIAMAAYFGGALCVWLGFLLALAGFVIRRLRRPTEPDALDR